MRFTLHVVSRNAEPFDLHVEVDSYTIGRSSSADLVIRDPSISRQHARLYVEDGQLFVEDLSSHNGSWVNGEAIHSAHPVSVGDEIVLALDLENDTFALRISVNAYAAQTISEGLLDTQETVVRSAMELFQTQFGANIEDMDGAEELRDFAQRLHILNEVHNAMSTSMSVQDLLELILARVFTFLKPEAATIFLEDEFGNLVPAAQRLLADMDTKPVFSDTLVRQMSMGGNALLVHDALHDTRFATAKSLHTAGIRSLIASPLLDEHGSLGLIMLYSRGVYGQFSEKDMELLVSLAGVATLRLRNLRLMEQAQGRLQRQVEEQTQELNARKEELETLDAIVRSINMEHRLERVLNSVLEQGSVLFPQADMGAFLLRDETDGKFRVKARLGFGDELEEIVLTLEEAKARYTNSTQELDQGVYLADAAVKELNANVPIAKSMLVMTVVVDEELEGFLVFDNYSNTAFNQSDLRRLARFRDHAISAVARARLLHRLQQKTEEITRTQNQLLIREKMASLGHLTSGVSHEINNPNNYIYGGAQNLDVFLNEFQEFLNALAGDDMDESLRHLLREWFERLHNQVKTIIIGSRRISHIVGDLQLVSRMDEAHRKRVDLLQSLSACVNLLEPSFSEVTFYCDFRGPLTLDCFPAELNQVFMNVIINACEAMLQNQQEEKVLNINARNQDNTAKLTFQDNGPGINQDILNHIFEAFFTTKPPGDHSGLGLYTSYKIVEQHQGQIEVHSTPGTGTLLTVTLPLVVETSLTHP